MYELLGQLQPTSKKEDLLFHSPEMGTQACSPTRGLRKLRMELFVGDI